MLKALGAKTLHLPAIEIIDPESWEAADNAIGQLEEYDGVFFTSRNAVQKFVRRVETAGPEAMTRLAQKKIYAVGEKTREVLDEHGLAVAATPDVFSAEALAETIGEQDVSGRYFLFPRSNIGKDIVPTYLREMGATVDEIVVYQTVSPAQRDLDSVRNALHNGEVAAAAFFSPSALRNFIQMMGKNALQQTAVAVIGPSTGNAASAMGVQTTIIARQATAESLVEAIVDYFGKS
jgi:uroporphyrinogen III methyltransferase/synthase